MYYLSNFCRICVQTGVKLLDIDTLDFDSIKLSEKLEVCTKMVVGRDSFSKEICLQCITKLRISYQFQNMCRKSTSILQQYLVELINGSADEGSVKVGPDHFVNTELTVQLTRLPSPSLSNPNLKRKRNTKVQRCSLLRQLLSPEKIKRRDKLLVVNDGDYTGNGLRDIINFTRNYEFGYDFEKEPSHLEKLTEFSNNFFQLQQNDFTQFQDTILYIIENKDNFCDSDVDNESDFFENQLDEEDKENCAKFITEIKVEQPEIQCSEELIVEPDIKREIDSDEDTYLNNNHFEADKPLKITCPLTVSSEELKESKSTSMYLLDRLVKRFNRNNFYRKGFSSLNMRCRTRNRPYISPMLKQQFLYRSFKCDQCNRYFKSPGYLKAHNSKVHY